MFRQKHTTIVLIADWIDVCGGWSERLYNLINQFLKHYIIRLRPQHIPHASQIHSGGRIALHDASQGGHLHIIKYLVEHCNCNPSHLDSKRVTPLHMAAQHGHLEVMQYLTLEQHCDPLCTDKNNTPLHLAANNGHLQLVRFFVEVLHCPPDIRGSRNEIPLGKARSRGHRHVVQYLESIHPKLQ